jgi:putative endonuclease
MNYKKILGDKGERKVAEYLKKHKYKIVARNYSCKLGEIDIIAENKEYIVFVEVKTRAEGQMFEAREAVNYSKQQKIIKTATFYLGSQGFDKQPRFDVAEVIVDTKGKMQVNYFENAFWQEKNGYAVF